MNDMQRFKKKVQKIQKGNWLSRRSGWMYAALCGAVCMGFGIVFIVCGLLFGCATADGVIYDHYDNVTITQDVIPPRPPTGTQPVGQVWDYWRAPVTAVVRVYNNRPYPVRVDLDCGLYEPRADILPYRHSSILVPTDMTHACGPLCVVLHEGPASQVTR